MRLLFQHNYLCSIHKLLNVVTVEVQRPGASCQHGDGLATLVHEGRVGGDGQTSFGKEVEDEPARQQVVVGHVWGKLKVLQCLLPPVYHKHGWPPGLILRDNLSSSLAVHTHTA